MSNEHQTVEKIHSGISGFDTISHGGLPKGRATLVSGTVGSGKTIFAAQFLAEGIKQWDEHAVFVTFEETPEEIRKNMASFGWDIAAWEEEGKWAFVDASLHQEDTVVIGKFDLKGLMVRIEHAVAKVGATRISLDSIGAIIAQFVDESVIRREIFWGLGALKEMKLTGVITAERNEEYGGITNNGLEAFVADNVIIMRNPLEEMTRRRTIEIVKFRGTSHQQREYPFTVVSQKGIVIVPFSTIDSSQQTTNIRVPFGIDGLDAMCGGGPFQNSVTMIYGPSGSGKTVMCTQFITGGSDRGERGLMMSFEESHAQLCRNALGWGVDLEAAEKAGRLKLISHYPEDETMEDILATIKLTIEEYKPQRLVLDSLSALERISSDRSFRTFVIGLTSFARQGEITIILTNTTAALVGNNAPTDTQISTITDSIILLRYVELNGQLRRAMTVVKMRGSDHDKNINEYTIDQQGIAIGEPFRDVAGILTGTIKPIDMSQKELLEEKMEKEQ